MTKTSSWTYFTLLCGVAGLIAMLIPTPVMGHDSWLHLNWFEQFAAQLHQGALYPRWLPLSNSSFGSPTFYFYPPLAAYIASLLTFVSANAPDIHLFRFVGYVGTFASLFSFRFYLRQLKVSPLLSWTGALLYAMLPYRAVDLVLRSAIGEHLAFAWIPLVFAGIEGIRNGDLKASIKSLMQTALGFALLILSNLPTAIAIGLATPIYAFLRHNKSISTALYSIGSLILGALLASFYLLPAMMLRSEIQSENLWAGASSRDGYAFTFTEFFTGNATELTYPNLVMLLSSVVVTVYLLRSRRKAVGARGETDRSLFIAWSVLTGLSLLMQLPVIGSFLSSLPVLEYLHFSWRWNVLLVPAIATLLITLLHDRPKPAALLSLILAATSIWVISAFNATREQRPTDVLKIEYSDASEYLPVAGPKSRRELVDFMRKHRSDPLIRLGGPGMVSPESPLGTDLLFSVDLPLPDQATFRVFYWPLWRLEADGSEIQLSADHLGRATAILPAGRYSGSLELMPHSSQGVGMVLTLISIALVGGSIFLSRARSPRRPT